MTLEAFAGDVQIRPLAGTTGVPDPLLWMMIRDQRVAFIIVGATNAPIGTSRFELVNLSVLGFNFAVMPLLVEVFGWPVLLPQLISLTVTAVYSWFAHRGFSFRRNPPKLGLLELWQAQS